MSSAPSISQDTQRSEISLGDGVESDSSPPPSKISGKTKRGRKSKGTTANSVNDVESQGSSAPKHVQSPTPPAQDLPPMASKTALNPLRKDLGWLVDYKILMKNLPCPFEPESSESQQWVEDVKLWLDGLNKHWNLPDYRSKDHELDLQDFAVQDMEVLGEVVFARELIEALEGLNFMVDTVVAYHPAGEEIGGAFKHLKGWSQACKPFLSKSN